MKIPFFSMFMSYVFGKFRGWLNLLNQQGTEQHKQEDEAQVVQQEENLEKESEDAADEIDSKLN